MEFPVNIKVFRPGKGFGANGTLMRPDEKKYVNGITPDSAYVWQCFSLFTGVNCFV